MAEHYTDETREKGAEALYRRQADAYRGGDYIPPWVELPVRDPTVQPAYIADARAVLDAVAGDIAARALEDAAEHLEDFIEAQRQHGKAAEAWYDGADEALELLTQGAARLREGGE